jgi:hypothetical protein
LVDCVHIFVGQYPDTSWLTGVALDEEGYVLVDEKHMTTIQNVFAVGDVVHGSVHRASAAIGRASECVYQIIRRTMPSKSKKEAQIAALNSLYNFHQYTDEQGRPLLGQYVAVRRGTEKPSTNNTTILDAVVKMQDKPNPPVMEGLMNSGFLSVATIAVAGNNPAAVVETQHPALIAFLLEQEKSGVSTE